MISRKADHMHGIIAALLTPMREGGARLDPEAASRLVAALVDRGIHGLFIAGSTGEGLLLTEAERQALVEAVLGSARNVPVVVHVGALTTAQAATLAAHAARAGAAGVAAIPPSYYAVTPEEVQAYYEAIARAAEPLPLYLYNIPSHARNDLTLPLVNALRRAIPSIRGIKDSSDDPGRIAGLVRLGGPAFEVISGNDGFAWAAFQGGARGLVSSGAGIFPEVYLALYRAWQDGRTTDAEATQAQINALQRVLGDGARLGWYKHGWRLQGLPIGGVRPPLADPSPAEGEEIRKGLKALGLLQTTGTMAGYEPPPPAPGHPDPRGQPGGNH